MKLSLWRGSFKDWLSGNIQIDSWLLDRPDTYTQTMGFMPPLRQIGYEILDDNLFYLSATQDLVILKRFTSEYLFQDLPISVLEGLYNTLAVRLLHDFMDIHEDITALDLETVNQPINITEVSEDQGDWLVEMTWSFRVNIRVEPETGTLNQSYTINTITSAVWNDSYSDDLTDGVSDTDKRILDFTFKTT